MRKTALLLGAFSLLSLAPRPVYAAQTFSDVVNVTIVPFFDQFVIPLMYAVMFFLFIFGVMRYFFTGGEENREKGKQFILWGILGIVAVFAVWGIVNLLLSVLAV
jgi:hypothetical protein